MGGKSTLMRTLATNIILAQIGAYVYADYFELSPVDQIFTRIGAADKLDEHKSTLYRDGRDSNDPKTCNLKIICCCG